MKAKFELTNPNETELTIHITMTLSSWKQKRRILDTHGGACSSWELNRKREETVKWAQDHFETIESIPLDKP